MTSVYEEKIYPDLSSVPTDSTQHDESQAYRLKKIDEMEKFLRDEVSYRDTLTKKCKRRASAFSISDTSVITAITALEIASLITLATGVVTPIGVPLQPRPQGFFRFLNIWMAREISPGYLWPFTKFDWPS